MKALLYLVRPLIERRRFDLPGIVGTALAAGVSVIAFIMEFGQPITALLEALQNGEVYTIATGAYLLYLAVTQPKETPAPAEGAGE